MIEPLYTATTCKVAYQLDWQIWPLPQPLPTTLPDSCCDAINVLRQQHCGEGGPERPANTFYKGEQPCQRAADS